MEVGKATTLSETMLVSSRTVATVAAAEQPDNLTCGELAGVQPDSR